MSRAGAMNSVCFRDLLGKYTDWEIDFMKSHPYRPTGTKGFGEYDRPKYGKKMDPKWNLFPSTEFTSNYVDSVMQEINNR